MQNAQNKFKTNFISNPKKCERIFTRSSGASQYLEANHLHGRNKRIKKDRTLMNTVNSLNVRNDGVGAIVQNLQQNI